MEEKLYNLLLPSELKEMKRTIVRNVEVKDLTVGELEDIEKILTQSPGAYYMSATLLKYPALVTLNELLFRFELRQKST